MTAMTGLCRHLAALLLGLVLVLGSGAVHGSEEAEAVVNDVAPDVVSELIDAVGAVLADTPGWAWAMLFGGILAGLMFGKGATMVLRRIGKRLRDAGLEARAAVFESAAAPSSLAFLTFGVHIGLMPVAMTPEVSSFAASIIQFLFILALGWFLYNLVDLVDIALSRHIAKSESKFAAQITPLIRKAFRIFVVVIFVLFIAQNVFGVNIGAWLAGLGIAGLAISLASQDSIRNLFGSVTVMLDKPFAVGDRIVFSGIEGFVEEIGLRSTRIRTFAGHVVTVPNMRFIDNSVENVSQRQFLRRALNVTITYDTPPEKIDEALQVIKDILSEEDMTGPFNLEARPPRVYFNDLNADSLNISVSYWYFLDAEKGHDWWHYQAHAELFNKRLFARFNAAGIDFAFPTQTLHLAGDPSRELAVRVLREAS